MGFGIPAKSGWQETNILLRPDIAAEAGRQGIDIGETCNQALALRLGLSYPDPAPSAKGGEKVIVAEDPPRPKRAAAAKSATPVINAEDPAIPGKVLKEHREKKVRAPAKPESVQEPARAPSPAPKKEVSAPPAPAPVPVALKEHAKGAKKAPRPEKKEDAVKRFVSTRITREIEEGPDTIIPKDDLYERFARWCRDHDYTAIPDRRAFTVALKNKYAIPERTVGGIPSWLGIRIK